MMSGRRRIERKKNIVQVFDFFENSETIFIVMEYCDSGDLFEYLDKSRFNLSHERIR